MAIFSLFLDENICCGTHWKCLNETLPMSTHNICFLGEIRKLELWNFSYPGFGPIDFPPIIIAIPLTEGETSVYGTILAEVCPRNSTSI